MPPHPTFHVIRLAEGILLTPVQVSLLGRCLGQFLSGFPLKLPCLSSFCEYSGLVYGSPPAAFLNCQIYPWWPPLCYIPNACSCNLYPSPPTTLHNHAVVHGMSVGWGSIPQLAVSHFLSCCITQQHTEFPSYLQKDVG